MAFGEKEEECWVFIDPAFVACHWHDEWNGPGTREGIWKDGRLTRGGLLSESHEDVRRDTRVCHLYFVDFLRSCCSVGLVGALDRGMSFLSGGILFYYSRSES